MELRCLIVDDSRRFVEAARRLLELQDVRVVGTAETGGRALELAAALRPDVALVDVGLGEESGFEVARRLETVPVILISTRDPDDLGQLVAASSAVGFLPKARLSGPAIRALLSGPGGGRPDR
ncbi:response regulator [Nonomuraea gerenzanensis]|uniref:DNA-binding response regulator, LuxR family n=1 Tax=Nonomuraea gerenzanensis TaxID=93944 RepID=A0A1M4E9Y1_9ACTN|nr:response regulator transcription factor [Nonomuraea gerenzanensis]UBU17939.1 response regulator transcription factor [Nonomuraea gerenzanensis]SBO95737.1 DNA-binding response regulator, LuxR family [Nonomuraea gerenzanensis]